MKRGRLFYGPGGRDLGSRHCKRMRERETNETNTAAGKIFGWRKRRLRDDDDDGDVWESLGANCQLCATFSQIKADSPDGRRRGERGSVFMEREKRRMPLVSPLVFAPRDGDDESDRPSGAMVAVDDDDGKRSEVSRCRGNGRFSANNKARSGVLD